MAKVTIQFDTGNAAFDGDASSYHQEATKVVVRALNAIGEAAGYADGRPVGPISGKLADSNGNTIGSWKVEG